MNALTIIKSYTESWLFLVNKVNNDTTNERAAYSPIQDNCTLLKLNAISFYLKSSLKMKRLYFWVYS
jgi:hypothetical protein